MSDQGLPTERFDEDLVTVTVTGDLPPVFTRPSSPNIETTINFNRETVTGFYTAQAIDDDGISVSIPDYCNGNLLNLFHKT